MKVRRKSEIAEAVANAIIEAIPVTKYLEQPVKGILLETITEILAAHYEPVPEPPARDEMRIRILIEQDGQRWIAHCLELDLVSVEDSKWKAVEKLTIQMHAQIDFALKNNNESAIWFPAPKEYFDKFAAVSEEQPASVIPPEIAHMLKIKNAHLEDETPAPHRATIAMIPCAQSNQKCWHIEIDGVRPDGELGMCGTEAEAKAKLESLRGENHGDT